MISPPALLPDPAEELITESRAQARGVRVKERRGRQHLKGQRKSETETITETVGGRRRMLSLLKAAREDAAAAVVLIETRLALRYNGQ